MNATITRPLKRMLRQAAPRLATRLNAMLHASPTQAPPLDAFSKIRAELEEIQSCFDAAHRVDDASLQAAARESSLVVLGVAPFANVSMLIDELARERIVLGELVIVDATAELPRGVAIRDHVNSWCFKLPLTRITVVAHSRQEFRYADAINDGLSATRLRNVWIAGADYVPLDRCFEYLFKTLISTGGRAVVVAHTFLPDGSLQRVEIPQSMLETGDCTLSNAEQCAAQNGLGDVESIGLKECPLLVEYASFRRGIFGGERQLLLDERGTNRLDTRFVTEVAVADLALDLCEQQTRLVASLASAALSLRARLSDAPATWEVLHDWRWLLDKRLAARTAQMAARVERIELVCPFHRGDVVLATQVAAHAASLGITVRLHVAAPLLSWVNDISSAIDVEPVPVPVASAVDTYPQLLAAYRYVSQRADASPKLARCHPSRSLSETGENLLGYMLEEVGLPSNTRVRNLKPVVTNEQWDIARQILEPFGKDVIFVHPVGGWDLKSIPSHTLAELAECVHEAGFKLIQIGGSGDSPLAVCDGAILRNFLPSQWCAILTLGRAMVGVDSWTAHFAAILNIPQVSLYGSTHPRHVNTKAWFAEQSSPSLVLGPIVNCSPCNSLKCVTFPGREYCTGYTIDRRALADFFSSLPAHTSAD
ncbi:hypothetical protein NDK50_03510 [Paraburkholderia bryophila]|uniref:glycosyltransferase family 9 protein n=1 Tax=Paraburkholderia bryophila TaxID=420952 RepID=UPI0023491AD0|nr:glycosyltransferase family 9 protein [Paraburkholderia bryophila]WCM20556.1 hypothetical protein NDK50_03510 [Paraburkholderia bryophila]